MKSILASIAVVLLFFIISADLAVSSTLQHYYADVYTDTGEPYPHNAPDYDYDDRDDIGPDEDEEPVGPQPEFSFEPQDLKVTIGQDLEIPCTVEQPTSQVLVIQYKKNLNSEPKILYVGTMNLTSRYQMDFTTSVMTISKVKKNDAGMYICMYQGGAISKLQHTVDVQYPPKILDSSEDQIVEEGKSVTLKCRVSGNPKPTLTWSKVDGHMPSGDEGEKGISMTLADVDRHVEGTYMCTADNKIGEPATAEMAVTVNYSPDIFTEKEIIRTGEGDKVELVCVVHARPGAHLTWTKDGTPVDENDQVAFKHEGHRHVLEISQVTKDNFGSYACSATNNLGSSESVISLTDEPKKPNFTSNPNSGEDTSYTLTWNTESYYPIQKYRIRYRKTKTNDSSDMPGQWSEDIFVDITEENVESNGLEHMMRHTFSDLQPATNYEALVQVRNKDEWGEEGMFTFSTKRASPTTTTTTSKPHPLNLAENPPSNEEVSSQITGGANSLVASLLMLVMASLVVPYCS